MASTHCVVDSFRTELAEGVHDLTGDTLKLALYTEDAALGRSTTEYSATNEASGSGYSAGGATVSPSLSELSQGKQALYLASAVSWPGSTFSFRYALLYNSSQGNAAIAVYDFGMTYTAVAQTVALDFPATASQALLVI